MGGSDERCVSEENEKRKREEETREEGRECDDERGPHVGMHGKDARMVEVDHRAAGHDRVGDGHQGGVVAQDGGVRRGH